MVRDVPGGVVLVSGDVHTSRLLLHPTQASAGRDLWEVVSSPMHAGVHDSSLWSRSDWVKEHFPHPNMMALFTARQEGGVATLGVRFVDKDGAVFMDRELVRVESNARAAVIEAAADREGLHRLRRVIEPWFMDGERPAPAAGSLAGQRAEATATIEALRALLGPSPGACRLEPVGDGTTLMTAYASPRVRESVSGDARSAFFTRPAWLPPGGEGPTRAQWLAAASMDPPAHPVLAYGDDAFNVYMAAVNGSVQLERADGTMRCLVHDGTNERPYTSLATSLVDRGALAAQDATLDGLRALWGREPAVVQAACDGNERFVWWREVPCDQWPQSPFGMRLLAGQAAAVDASVIPIGSLLLLVPEPVDASLPPELRAPRIVYAADCGGAIRGAERIDLYLGAGDDALATAGRVKARVRVYRISAQ
jgi:3D (Asp-Asp-Asp) domain-containing protein